MASLILIAAVKADATTSCPEAREIYEGCMEVIGKADKTIEALHKARAVDAEVQAALEKKISIQEQEMGAWYRDWRIMVPLGVLIGIGVK